MFLPLNDPLNPEGARIRARLEKLKSGSAPFQWGRGLADLAGIAQALLEISGGATTIGGGAALVPTGAGTAPGAVAIAAGYAQILHGAAVGGASVQDLSNLISYVFRSDNSGAGGSGNFGEGEDLPGSSSESVQFTPTQAARIKTIDEIAHNWKVRKTLLGELLDQGHITKIEEGMNALEKAKTALQNSLRNPKLNQATRKAMQSRIDTANHLITRAKELLGR